ncbi:unnamed protein product [Gadus morhua 'NCC']
MSGEEVLEITVIRHGACCLPTHSISHCTTRIPALDNISSPKHTQPSDPSTNLNTTNDFVGKLWLGIQTPLDEGEEEVEEEGEEEG